MAAGTEVSARLITSEERCIVGDVPARDGDFVNDSPYLKHGSNAKPPMHLSSTHHSSLATVSIPPDLDFNPPAADNESLSDGNMSFLPIIRSGCCAEKGSKQYMEDEHICVDNLHEHFGEAANFPSPGAFYGVFDGHGGMDAALFVRENILKFIFEDSCFPSCVRKAIEDAFLKADHAFADESTLDISSGTTALTALIFGRNMIIANAGDCRAVLGKRGRATELSKDHKPNHEPERLRIEKLGGAVYDGYLNGQLSVSRALGDWHMKGPKGSCCPLSAEPELQETILSEDDEFLIMGCDGLWDVMSSQCAVTIVRNELMVHNDPVRCSRELVREALKRNTCDNLTVIVVCFSQDPPSRIELLPARVHRSISSEGVNLLKGVLDCNV